MNPGANNDGGGRGNGAGAGAGGGGADGGARGRGGGRGNWGGHGSRNAYRRHWYANLPPEHRARIIAQNNARRAARAAERAAAAAAPVEDAAALPVDVEAAAAAPLPVARPIIYVPVAAAPRNVRLDPAVGDENNRLAAEALVGLGDLLIGAPLQEIITPSRRRAYGEKVDDGVSPLGPNSPASPQRLLSLEDMRFRTSDKSSTLFRFLDTAIFKTYFASNWLRKPNKLLFSFGVIPPGVFLFILRIEVAVRIVSVAVALAIDYQVRRTETGLGTQKNAR
eukprot:scaffold34924_cov125-Amphora_coffeaeformis.AAC.4